MQGKYTGTVHQSNIGYFTLLQGRLSRNMLDDFAVNIRKLFFVPSKFEVVESVTSKFTVRTWKKIFDERLCLPYSVLFNDTYSWRGWTDL